jgi:hypothetical protein
MKRRGDIEQLHVVIELKTSNQYRATEHLLKYVDQALLSQPNRIFVNGITVTGSKVTFNVFGRSAVYESSSF